MTTPRSSQSLRTSRSVSLPASHAPSLAQLSSAASLDRTGDGAAANDRDLVASGQEQPSSMPLASSTPTEVRSLGYTRYGRVCFQLLWLSCARKICLWVFCQSFHSRSHSLSFTLPFPSPAHCNSSFQRSSYRDVRLCSCAMHSTHATTISPDFLNEEDLVLQLFHPPPPPHTHTHCGTHWCGLRLEN